MATVSDYAYRDLHCCAACHRHALVSVTEGLVLVIPVMLKDDGE
jgi:hypothetical protein